MTIASDLTRVMAHVTLIRCDAISQGQAAVAAHLALALRELRKARAVAKDDPATRASRLIEGSGNEPLRPAVDPLVALPPRPARDRAARSQRHRRAP